MPIYIFEIQNCITTRVIADNVDEARSDLLYNLASFADDMINDCCVSDGEQLDD